MEKIGMGGSCHWCTEAIFQSLKGVDKVEQGFVASEAKNGIFSEAVLVHYNKAIIPLKDLIEIHLHTHESTSNHSMRQKYRSAVYSFSEAQRMEAKIILIGLQPDFERTLITEVLPFMAFKPSDTQFFNYYYSDPKKPFCRNYIQPKLKLLLEKFSGSINVQAIYSRLHT
ncbi:hypothetical protein LCGC14_0628540 [marine sediment metagenome]|uniref:peptide-methionine (S)-S-oxide reductase n=2 Tax=root TaxID=1 RepID=A0A831QKT7_9FLAO|nr:peptide methionine sulfoxide reductase [Pricia sp.]HEA20255.1 peptide methionine sulfoxide reductase [Pricia antarctica]